METFLINSWMGCPGFVTSHHHVSVVFHIGTAEAYLMDHLKTFFHFKFYKDRMEI